MSLDNSFAMLLQFLVPIMTAPSYANFCVVVTGWIFAGRHTITQMLYAAGAVGRRHHSAFHRLFATACWSRDRLGLGLFNLLVPWLKDPVFLAVDDTLARKRGQKMFGTGMHHDPLLSSRSKVVINRGHNWVVLHVLVRFALWPDRCFALPILFRLYLNHPRAVQEGRTYRTRPELALQLIGLLCGRRPSRQFHVVADSAYGGKSVLGCLPENCQITSRLLLTARLHEAPPPRGPGARGRCRKRGPQLPAPQAMLNEQARRVTLSLYGRQEEARLSDVEARLFAVPHKPVRVIAVEALTSGRGRQAFYSTAVTATAEQILGWYAQRWAAEVAFHDSKQFLGFEQPQGWTRNAVERTAPVAMILYSLIILWFVQEGHQHYQPPVDSWYASKPHASFRDMLVTLRRQSVQQQLFSLGLPKQATQKTLALLENAVSQTV
jgi:hypothetical protein